MRGDAIDMCNHWFEDIIPSSQSYPHNSFRTPHSVNYDAIRKIAPVPQIRVIDHYSIMYCAAIDQGTTR